MLFISWKLKKKKTEDFLMALSGRHLLGLQGVPKEDIQLILDTATTFREVLERPIKKVPTLQGKTVVNLFYESSTRTRISFELAEKRLSADAINFSSSTSSVTKGETLKDTIRNIEAMKVDMVVVRHAAAGTPLFLTRVCDSNIINAGDGAHEHPTQALLDMYSIKEKLGRIDGLKVCIVGDVAHSRVALSNIFGLKTMGADVSVCGPSTMIPKNIEELGVKVIYNIDEAIQENDVLNVLRIQLERKAREYFPSIREYAQYFGITEERLEKSGKEDILILHPGPINRGVELSSEVADGMRQIILRQVTNGVAVRMAVLYLLGTMN
jgi:aspartate carbamoyltransferase catalytic subunit